MFCLIIYRHIAILYYPSNIGYLKYVFLLNKPYKLFIQKK